MPNLPEIDIFRPLCHIQFHKVSSWCYSWCTVIATLIVVWCQCLQSVFICLILHPNLFWNQGCFCDIMCALCSVRRKMKINIFWEKKEKIKHNQNRYSSPFSSEWLFPLCVMSLYCTWIRGICQSYIHVNDTTQEIRNYSNCSWKVWNL